jgi:iron complex outermembrane receptor protein
VAREKKREFRDWDYWGRPVPGFGDPRARLLVVGLAPAAHGGNRTGRMFTGDSSGDWLYGALHRFGFATQPHSVSRDDGQRLDDCYITAAARCAPPGNRPTPHEIANCRPHLAAELALLRRVRVVVTLGRIGHEAYLRASGWWDRLPPRDRPHFAHGAATRLPDGVRLISSYHPSRQNTNTGRLTRAMWHAVFRRARALVGTAALVILATRAAAAQDPITPAAGVATVRVRVVRDTSPEPGVTVSSGAVRALTDALGWAALRLPAGSHRIIAASPGLRPDTVAIAVRAGADTSFVVRLTEVAAELMPIIVTATRGERRIEEEPVRVEVVTREEIVEKLLMTPGDIAMLLNETPGLRVQTTSPSLGGANVRVQGLRGRYTQVLADGLPLHGGQTGGLGLLQIPPIDLGQVEVIKGAASALYGASALGGVINLVSRSPGRTAEREGLLNATSRGGADGVLFASGPVSDRWGYTLLAGAHTQAEHDRDGDGWADLAGYRRLVVRPRARWIGAGGGTLFVTAGATLETREGGTVAGRVAPDSAPFAEALDTRRFDVGAVGRFPAGSGTLAVRGSLSEQRHDHQFGPVSEADRHRTGFIETAFAVPSRGWTWVAGLAFQEEVYRAADVPGFDYVHTTPSAFAQAEVAGRAGAVAGSVRIDRHSAYGTFVNPRFSALLRLPGGWTARVSGASGVYAPTPFTEETEVTGLAPVEPLRDLVAERSVSAALDVGGLLGAVEVNLTLFGSRIRDAIVAVEPVNAPGRVALTNAPGPTRSAGFEILARLVRDPWHVTAAYTHLRSSEWDPSIGARRATALTPRHAVGLVGAHEVEDRWRAGIELYYTGRQALADNPYRTESPAYLIIGALFEVRAGRVRPFVNLENLTDVRLTQWQPLVRPSPGLGGRWTTDAWTELAGRTVNGGVRLAW